MRSLLALSAIFVLVQSSPFRRGPEARIVGGFEADPHSIPYQVGLLSYVPNDTLWCGGSLISREWVLTAAHCVGAARKVTVVLGLHDMTYLETSRRNVDVHLSGIHINPKFNLHLIQNDVALIKLPSPVKLDENIQTVKLPSRQQVKLGEKFIGRTATVSGWGQTSNNRTSSSPRLRYVQLPILSNEACSEFFMGLVESHLCIDGRGIKGTCQGDSGGPLTVKDEEGIVTQVGVVSFVSPEGCEVGWPSVFARVTSFMDWIETVTGLSFD